MTCPICGKRKAERFCPAKGEKICAVCCGTEREVTMDCPFDCVYLAAAHRYEDEQKRSIPGDTPLLGVQIPEEVVHTHQQLVAALAFSIAKFCAAQASATDTDVLGAIAALAETYKTLDSGIVYENSPAASLPRELCAALATFLDELKKKQAETAGSIKLEDKNIFYVLVFLHRMGLLRTNGRLRARRYIEFLRGQFPQSAELKREENRIIVP